MPRRGEDAVEDLGFAAHVELRGGLVEQHDPRALPHGTQRSGQGHSLPLPAGEVGPPLVAARQDGLEAGQARGAGLVLLDEPTAQLDVRGEAEIFDRILGATRQCTTLLISHRFSTVRHADRICVLEHGRVVELGPHDQLMALGGRYRTMFDLQAKRFAVVEGEEGMTYDVLT